MNPRLERFERVLRGVDRAMRAIEGETVRLRAMSLTYITLFALVPALVVAFAVVQAFTGMDRISGAVHEFLLENLAVGARATIEPYLERFIRNAQTTRAGLVGGAILVWSSVSLFSNVERAVNDIWGIRRRRSVAQQAVIYWVWLTLGPLLLAASVSVSAAARALLASAGVQFLAVVAAGALTSVFFATLYLLVPNTKVRLRAALIGGVAAGVLWEAAKWLFTIAVGTFFRYNAIYGSVAALPIFLTWLFLSWSILLLGARLAYVVQYAASVMGGAPRATSRPGKEILAGRVLLAVAKAYDDGEPAPDVAEVANRLRVVGEEASDAVAALRQAGLVVSLAGGGLVPSRPLEKLKLLDVRRAVDGRQQPAGGSAGHLEAVVKQIEDRAAEQLDEITFRELCDRERGVALTPPGEAERTRTPPKPSPCSGRPLTSEPSSEPAPAEAAGGSLGPDDESAVENPEEVGEPVGERSGLPATRRA
jgi:membrane protein